MSILVTSEKLRSVHASIDAALTRALPVKVNVFQYPDTRPLNQFSKDDRVSFALKAADAIQDFAERDRGARVPVVPLHKMTEFERPSAWLGWYERWHKKEAEAYELTNVSATFFWGLPNRPEKQQVLRAEWDSDSTANAESGQPHWQFDPTYRWRPEQPTPQPRVDLATVELAELTEDVKDEGLVEYTEAVTHEISLSKMHLSMAGWRNGKSPSTWWKQSIPQPALFAVWVERVIFHTAEQFRLLSMKASA